MYEIYEKILKEKNIKSSDVSKAIGISSVILTHWKQGRSTPKTDTMLKIAEYLGVSVEYLTTGKESKSPIPKFSPIHIDLINGYEKLNENNKKVFIEIMNNLIAAQENV